MGQLVVPSKRRENRVKYRAHKAAYGPILLQKKPLQAPIADKIDNTGLSGRDRNNRWVKVIKELQEIDYYKN